MKTKPVHKKGKKRSLSETSLSSKLDKKSENKVETKQNFKKVKIDNTAQNGNFMPATKVQIFEKESKKHKKIREKNNTNEKLSEAKVTTNIAEETVSITAESKEKVFNKKKTKKLKDLKNKQLIHKANKNIPKKTQQNIAIIDVEQIKKKLAEIRSREIISKTARKKIASLQRKLSVAEAMDKSKKSDIVEKDDEKNKHRVNVFIEKEEKADFMNKGKAKEKHGKNKKVKIETKQNVRNDEDENDVDQSDVEEEEEEAMDSAEEKVDAGKIEDEEKDSDQEDDEDVASAEVKKKKKKITAQADKSSDVSKKGNTKKKRYILFVGNLPYDITTDELKQHFLTKVDAVTNVRHTFEPGTNKSRGFAHVEFPNRIDYEKGLSLHHTFLKKRRINVKYTAPKNVNQAVVIAKNKKLEALCKAGKLAGKLANVKGKKQISKIGKQKFVESKG